MSDAMLWHIGFGAKRPSAMVVDLTPQVSCASIICQLSSTSSARHGRSNLNAAVSRAYACLSDPDKRANYDRYG